MGRTVRLLVAAGLAAMLALAAAPADGFGRGASAASRGGAVGAKAVKPNIFFYNLDDLRDAFPGGIDPMQFMPKAKQWMSAGRRFTQMFVADPSCCPSRSSLMTGRYPHNNGVLDQQDGPNFDGPHSMACYLQGAGYLTYEDGKFLTTWPKTKRPPCFTHSTVMWIGLVAAAGSRSIEGSSQKTTVAMAARITTGNTVQISSRPLGSSHWAPTRCIPSFRTRFIERSLSGAIPARNRVTPCSARAQSNMARTASTAMPWPRNSGRSS